MMQFKISYELRNHGWAIVSLSDGQTTVERAASGLHDSLLDLAQMALSILSGSLDSTACFLDEPGELQLIVRQNDEKASYEVLWFPDGMRGKTTSRQDIEILLQGMTTGRRIVQQINQVLWKIHEQIEARDYHRRWGKEFPLHEYQRLAEHAEKM